MKTGKLKPGLGKTNPEKGQLTRARKRQILDSENENPSPEITIPWIRRSLVECLSHLPFNIIIILRVFPIKPL